MSDIKREKDSYVLGRTVEEYERLRTQAALYEEATRRTLEKAGIASQMRCLDAGCGPGEVMRLIGGMVGPGGFVSGIDMDEALGRHMLTQLQANHGRHYAFYAGDLTKLDRAPDGPYDLVFTRLTLFHIQQPVPVLQTLWSWVKPGGVLIAMDFDLSQIRTVPDAGPGAQIMHLIKETMTRAGRDISIGAHLPDLFMKAGIGPVAGTDVSSHLGPIGQTGGMARAVLNSLKEPATKLGIASAEEIAAVDQRFGETMKNSSLYLMMPLIVSTWARKVA